MAWIRDVGLEEAEGELARLYRGALEPDGTLDNVLAAHGLHPAGLAAHLALYRSAMRPTDELGAAEREMIAVLVSRANGCRY